MKLYLSNQEVVRALNIYMLTQRNCVRDAEETPNFQVTTDNRGLLMVEVEGYEPKTNPVHNTTDDVIQQEDSLENEVEEKST